MSAIPTVRGRRGRGLLVGLMVALGALLLSGQGVAALGPDAMRAGFEANELARNDDGSTSLVPIGFPVNFFGTVYDHLYVNNNGNVTFDSRLSTYTPFNLSSTSRVIIAPFFADVDTRSAGDPVRYGSGLVGGRPAFGATWRNVDCYSSNGSRTVRNHFQVVLIDRSDIGVGDFDIEFNYDQVQWEAGQASSGSFNCLGGAAARVGYSNGSDTSFELPGSGVNGAFLDSNADTGLVHNSLNSLQPGRYVFHVRNGEAPTGGAITGTVSVNPPVAGALVQVCRADGFCNLTTSNASGGYTVSALAPGVYTATAFAPAGANYQPASAGPVTLVGTETIVLDLVFQQPEGLPPGTTITNRGIGGNGIPIIYWRDDLDLITTGCEGGVASYVVVQNGSVIRSGPLTEGPPGTYTGVIAALYPLHGDATVVITIVCPGGATEVVGFDIYIDPSGNVIDTNGNPIAGATVTLFRSDSSSGPFDQVPDGSAIMSPANRTNPDATDGAGHFGWDVVAGYYLVRAEAADCYAPGDPGQPYVETAVLVIPPPVTDLELVLECPVENLPPTADAGGPYTVEEGGVVLLDGTGSSDPDGAIVSYEWDMDDDGVFDDASGATAAFSAAGLDGPDGRTVRLRVCDGAGACDEASAEVMIVNAAPVLEDVADATNESGEVHTVSAAFTDAGVLDTHTATIDWGEGAGPEPATVTEADGSGTVAGGHQYLTPGVYTVTITVIDDDGGSAVDTHLKTVVRKQIVIDIKPESEQNAVSLNGNGVLPVAVLTTDDFDATTIDPATVLFGVTGGDAAPVHGGHLEDVDGDGDLDLVLHVRTGDLGIPVDTAGKELVALSLTAATFEGVQVQGQDVVWIAPSNDNARGKGGNGPK